MDCLKTLCLGPSIFSSYSENVIFSVETRSFEYKIIRQAHAANICVLIHTQKPRICIAVKFVLALILIMQESYFPLKSIKGEVQGQIRKAFKAIEIHTHPSRKTGVCALVPLCVAVFLHLS